MAVFQRLVQGSSIVLKAVLSYVYLSLAALSSAAAADVLLQVSGSSTPAPLYAKWFQDFSASSNGIHVDYQSKGSGSGIQDFLNQVVDFAGSDVAMNDDEIRQAKGGVVLVPMTASSIVLT